MEKKEENTEVAVVRKNQVFVKGGPSPNPGGRPKGPSKKRLMLDNFLEVIVKDNTRDFQKEVKKLKGEAKVKAIMAMVAYLKPPNQRVDISNSDGSMKPLQVYVLGGKEIEF
jgi:hypothetical protein